MKELQTIEKTLKPMLKDATDFSCKSEEDYTQGGLLLKVFKEGEKQSKALKDKALKPSLETTAQIRGYFKPFEVSLSKCVTHVKSQMEGWYKQEQERLEKEKQRVLTDGRIRREDTVERKLAAIEDSAPNGNARSIRRLKVTDLAAIPLEFFDLNESRLKAALLEGREIQGATLVNDTIIVSR